jgi:hypothetical protein
LNEALEGVPPERIDICKEVLQVVYDNLRLNKQTQRLFTIKLFSMSASTEKARPLKGAEWLVKESSPFETFIPEDFNEEQQMVKDMCAAFLDAEVLPIIDRIDKLEPGLMPSLIAKRPANRACWERPYRKNMAAWGKTLLRPPWSTKVWAAAFLFP